MSRKEECVCGCGGVQPCGGDGIYFQVIRYIKHNQRREVVVVFKQENN